MRLSYLKLTLRGIISGVLGAASGGSLLFWTIGLTGTPFVDTDDPVGYAVVCLIFMGIAALILWLSIRGIRSVRRCVQFYRILSDDYVRSVRHMAYILDRPAEKVGVELSVMIARRDITGVHLDKRLDRILCLGDKKTYHL